MIGPYELQDFNIYYVTRFGFRPSKVAFLALHAWGDRARGAWPGAASPRSKHTRVRPGHHQASGWRSSSGASSR